MQEVSVTPVEPGRLARYIGDERADELERLAKEIAERFEGRTVWNVNSTATGGGVAEMLAQMVAYGLGAGVDTRWLVMPGNPEFFAITKRLHNYLHGSTGDGGQLDEAAQEVYVAAAKAAATELLERVSAGDVVILHDPQTAGLAESVADAGAIPVWRCHIGADEQNEQTAAGWAFLKPHLDRAAHLVFSRPDHVPAWARDRDVTIVPPAIDPFSTKNGDMDDATVNAILLTAGLLQGDVGDGRPVFTRSDGSTAEVTRKAAVVNPDGLPTLADRIVVQVSRWDRLKDMAGVMRGFAEYVAGCPDVDNGEGSAWLLLVGPSVEGVSDDPEGQQVFEECRRVFDELPEPGRSRICLVSLPMDDVEENAAMVNAVQRHASVVVQKSLAEGFGLTVAEAMWKSRPIVASAVGGIQDQVEDGVSGILLSDPTDITAFGAALRSLLADEDAARRCGHAARERVRERFLPDRQLIDWGGILASVE